MKGTLFLIPNTLGSHDTRSAVLPEAVQRLATECRYFVVESAKVARAFLKAIEMPVPLQSLNMQELNVNTPDAELKQCLQPLLDGHDVGLISDAGCPAVADPGARLVAYAHQKGVRVVPLVGPSSLLLALMASGLNGQRFAFDGYLPIDAAQRIQRIKYLEQYSRQQQQTQLVIETPYRNKALFETLLQTLQAETRLCVALDLSLPTEYILTQTVAQWRHTQVVDLHKRPCIFLWLS